MVSDPLSLSAVPCSTHTSVGQQVDQATAFLYEAMDGRLHLVTNWHVVTGRKPEEPTKSRTAMTPETLRCLVHKRRRPDSRGQQHVRLSQLATVDVHLNSADGNNPAWREHPDFRHRVDVVALDVTDTFLRDVHTFNIVNQIKRLDERFRGDVMDDVFVVGYPLGLSGSTHQPGALPLYKRGSIASEPSVSFGGLRVCSSIAEPTRACRVRRWSWHTAGYGVRMARFRTTPSLAPLRACWAAILAGSNNGLRPQVTGCRKSAWCGSGKRLRMWPKGVCRARSLRRCWTADCAV